MVLDKRRLLADNVTDVIWTADLELRLDYVSPSQEKLLGYTTAEALELPRARLFTPESWRHLKAALARTLQAGEADADKRQSAWTLDAEQVRKDGTLCWVEIRMSFLRDAGGAPVGVLGVSRDITEKRLLQASLAQADRLSSMGMLAAGVAHEINNPLTYVLYNLDSLAEDIPRQTGLLFQARAALAARIGEPALRELLGPAEEVFDATAWADVKERFDDALSGSQRIKQIARGLGTFARVEEDKVAPVDLRFPIESALDIAFNEIKYRARVVKDFSPAAAKVLASDGRLSQIFLNLLINAAHAIVEGNASENEIRVRTWQDGDHVCAEVRDTGCGIPEESLARVFEPFYTTKPVGVGSGLGLSIVKKIVTGYGGTVAATSEVGKGTVFTIRLPVAKAPAQAPGSRQNVVAQPIQVRGRVLVVDDEPGVRAALTRILRRHEVVACDSGERAKELISSDQRFDVVLCDMMMPAVSGIDVHRWLVQAFPRLAKQFIFVTGGAFTPSAQAYLNEVDVIRVEKPFDARSLAALVAEWVEARKVE